MSDTKKTLADVTAEIVAAMKADKEAQKSGTGVEERRAMFDQAVKELPHHKNPESKKTIGNFLKAMAEGDTSVMKDLGEANGGGGYLTPLEFSSYLIELLYKIPVIRPHATVYPMSSDQMQIPVENSTVSANWTAELATITQSDMTFGTNTLSVNNLIGISRMSRQLLLDSAINQNLVDLVMERFARSIGRLEDTAFMTGSGVGMPKGLRQYTYTHTLAQAGANLTGDDLINLYHSLPYQYREQGSPVWLINDLTLAKVRKLKDSQGRYIYEQGWGQSLISEGMTPTLLGKPVLVQNDIPTNLGGGTNASEIYFGDLSYYVIGDREQIFSEVSTQEGTSFAQHRAAIKVGERIDGQLTAVDGFAQLTAVI